MARSYQFYADYSERESATDAMQHHEQLTVTSPIVLANSKHGLKLYFYQHFSW